MVCVHGRQFNSRHPSGLNKRETFSGSVEVGSVLALSFYQGNLEPDCEEVLTRGGGAYARGGAYLRDTTVIHLVYVHADGRPFTYCCDISADTPWKVNS